MAPCRERLALDLNKCALDLNRDALDLNIFPLCSPEATPRFCFHTNSVAELPFDSLISQTGKMADPWTYGLQFQHKDGSERHSEESLSVVGGSYGSEKWHGNGAHKPHQFFSDVIQSPKWLPPCWITEIKTRKAGNTAAANKKYYKDPILGSPIKSRNGVIYFVETGKNVRRKRRLRHSATQAFQHAVVPNSSVYYHAISQPVTADVPLQRNSSMISFLNLGTPYMRATSEQSSSECLPDVPAWLRRILPVGVLPAFMDCVNSVYVPISQTEDNISQHLSRPLDIDLNVEADMQGAVNVREESTGLILQKHDEDMDTEAMNKVELDSRLNHVIRDTSAEEWPIVEQKGLIMRNRHLEVNGSNILEERCQSNGPSYEEDFALKQNIHFMPDQVQNQKNPVSCGNLGEHMDYGASFVPMNHLESLKSSRKAHGSMQHHNHNLTPTMLQQGILEGSEDSLIRQKCTSFHQGRQPRIKPVGIRKVQMLKRKEGKELLVLLGRKLCLKGLIFMAEKARQQSKEQAVN